MDIERGKSGSTLLEVVASISSATSFWSVGGLDEDPGDAILFVVKIVRMCRPDRMISWTFGPNSDWRC